MSRVAIRLASQLARPLLLAPCVLLVGYFTPHLLPFTIAGWVAIFVIWELWHFPLIRLCFETSKSHILNETGFSLYFRPSLHPNLIAMQVPTVCETDLKSLAHWFGFSLGKPVCVFLFENKDSINRVMRRPYDGFAIPRLSIILVSLDTGFNQFLRHELAHLFAIRVGSNSPELKSEGLAIWFQCDGRAPIMDRRTRRLIDKGCLQAILQSAPVHNDESRKRFNLIAGSFTDFLIGRFGWPVYSRFYGSANRWNFDRVFRQAFGMPLLTAESEWLEGLNGCADLVPTENPVR